MSRNNISHMKRARNSLSMPAFSEVRVAALTNQVMQRSSTDSVAIYSTVFWWGVMLFGLFSLV